MPGRAKSMFDIPPPCAPIIMSAFEKASTWQRKQLIIFASLSANVVTEYLATGDSVIMEIEKGARQIKGYERIRTYK